MFKRHNRGDKMKKNPDIQIYTNSFLKKDIDLVRNGKHDIFGVLIALMEQHNETQNSLKKIAKQLNKKQER